MLRGDIRTLLILRNERPPLEEIAQQTGTELRRRGRDAYTLVCTDGSTAALNFWQFERPQDHVSKTVLGLAAAFVRATSVAMQNAVATESSFAFNDRR